MKVKIIMAVSANGMIATKDGSEDFLSHDNWLRFVHHAKKVGNFIWGRKTYESVITWEGDYFKELHKVKKIIVSSQNLQLKPGFELANSPKEALEKLKELGYENVIVTGGATLNSEFAKRGLIDEVIFFVNPFIVGEGVPVFKPAEFFLKLSLEDIDEISDNIFEVTYKMV